VLLRYSDNAMLHFGAIAYALCCECCENGKKVFSEFLGDKGVKNTC
jgi:hypothetical protein